MVLELSNVICDELIKKLDDTVDSLESGLNCDVVTREIIREWFKSAQRTVQPTLLDSTHPYTENCHCSSCKKLDDI